LFQLEKDLNALIPGQQYLSNQQYSSGQAAVKAETIDLATKRYREAQKKALGEQTED